MIKFRLPQRPDSPPPRIYGVAGHRLSSDAPLPELEAFRPGRHLPRRGSARIDDGTSPHPREHVFRGSAELGPKRYLLDCSWHGEGYELSVAGLGRFAIDRYGERITVDQIPGSGDHTGFSEIFLGPSLTLALALRGIWCLHASAVEIDGMALAFLGASGAGKSTLARTLPALSAGRFRCAADDVLPIDLDDGRARALPRFPQLKYRPDQQPGASVPPCLPLTAIYLLDTETASAGGVAVEPLTGHAAILALVSHTHSARLFSRELLRRHTDACARLARRLPIRRLVYPREWESLPRVEKLLRSESRSVTAPALAQIATRTVVDNDDIGRNPLGGTSSREHLP